MKAEKVNSSKVVRIRTKLNRKFYESNPGTRNYRRAVKGLHQIGELNKDEFKMALQGRDIRKKEFIDPGNSTGRSTFMEKLWFCLQVEDDARKRARKALQERNQADFKENMQRIIQAKLARKEQISLHAS